MPSKQRSGFNLSPTLTWSIISGETETASFQTRSQEMWSHFHCIAERDWSHPQFACEWHHYYNGFQSKKQDCAVMQAAQFEMPQGCTKTGNNAEPSIKEYHLKRKISSKLERKKHIQKAMK